MNGALSLEVAQERLLALANPLPAEEVAVSDALGRTLAHDVRAARTQPARDLSAMDGYAVSGSGPWTLIGESRAGHPFVGQVRAAQAIRISTGALMPEGTTTVLLQEDAVRDGMAVTATAQAPIAGQHVRHAGFDFRAGDTLLKAGDTITPGVLALALSAGLGKVLVTRKPRVVLIDTGDELAVEPAGCQPHQIPASNGAMLAALYSRIPCDIKRIGPIADELAALTRAFGNTRDADVVVTTGGASVGDHDLVRPALESLGAALDFWRVAIKPGKPMLVARRDPQVVIGLPGNPVSAFVTGYLFVMPFLRALSGQRSPVPAPVMMPLAKAMAAGGSRREFLRGICDGGVVAPLEQTDSSALRTLAAANALIDRPAHADEVKAGTPVPVYLLENG